MMSPLIIPDDVTVITEQLGTKFKSWIVQEPRNILFKQGRPETGENWAEVVSAKLCGLLHLPHAEYRFAVWRNRLGVVSPTFIPRHGWLVHGNELMLKRIKGYNTTQKYNLREHTLRSVLAIMMQDSNRPPIGLIPFSGAKTAIDYFIGYILFDAWISNQDRHHQNWSFIVKKDDSMHLAPTYDHASSLGCRLTDVKRADRLVATSQERGVLGLF